MALGSRVARSIGAGEVIKHLERLFARHGKPKLIRADNGRQFIADTLQECLAEQQVYAAFIEKASGAAELLPRAVQRVDAPRAAHR